MTRFVLISSMIAMVSCASTGDTPDGGGATEPGGGGGDSGGVSDGGSSDSAYQGGLDGGTGAHDANTGASDAGHDAATDAAGEAAASGPGPYGADGPYTVTTATFQVAAPNGTFTTTAYIPSAAGPDPVVIFSSGLQQPALAYAPYAQRLASWGVITFLRDDPGVLGEGTTSIAADVVYMATTWLAATNTSTSSALDGKVDTSKIGLAGHSRGGQVALLAAEGGAHGLVDGVFGVDPVDTAGDGGVGQAASRIASIGVPIAFIGETTDSAASSCAPATENYQVLYQAAASPAVSITAIDADHTMFENAASCSFCTLCTAGTASQPLVLATAVRYLTAFFARQLLGDATVGPAFAGAGADQDVAAGTIQLVSK